MSAASCRERGSYKENPSSFDAEGGTAIEQEARFNEKSFFLSPLLPPARGMIQETRQLASRIIIQ